MLKTAFKNIDNEMAGNMVKIAKMQKKITASIKNVKGLDRTFKKMQQIQCMDIPLVTG